MFVMEDWWQRAERERASLCFRSVVARTSLVAEGGLFNDLSARLVKVWCGHALVIERMKLRPVHRMERN